MDLKSLGEAIIKLGAPLLGTVIGGPAGGAIGQIVASEFGGDVNNPSDLISKISADPDAGLKIAAIQADQKVKLQSLAIQMAENQLQAQNNQLMIEAQDTEGARELKIESKSNMPEIISVLVFVSMAICIVLVTAIKEDTTNEHILYMLFGSIASAFASVVQFWLGSSIGSKMKDLTIKNMSS